MTRHQEGPYGGDGGKPFSLDYFTSILKIRVAYTTVDGSNSSINGITICYTVNGVQQPPVTFGGPGKESPEFTLQTGEYITRVKGYYGVSSEDNWRGVKELTFQTSSGITKGPYGDHKEGADIEFELPANNGTIVGFFGRADTRLDALGAYIEDGDTGGSTGTGNI